ncbi:MAG: hypothetical protein K2X39_01690 [Silvanigrellaceae bacterium]|nr:hypothetical protein [Silvanigrellaceae bacterium]
MPETTNNCKPPFSYSFQRTLWPLTAGFGAFLLWHNDLMPGDNAAIPAFIAYVTIGLIYDWLVFSYLGYKDSGKLTNEQHKLIDITVVQLDKLNEFYTMVRRFAFAASVSATAGCYLFFPDMSVMGSFFFAYMGVTIILISIGIFTKEIIFRYTAKNVLVSAQEEPPGGMYTPTGLLIDPTGRVININR